MKQVLVVIVAAALAAAVIVLALQRGRLPAVQGETQVYDKPPR